MRTPRLARSLVSGTRHQSIASSVLVHPSKKDSSSSPLPSPLAKLPLSSVLRSLVILSISSSSLLLRPCIYTLSHLANPKTSLLDVAKNPLLNLLVKHTLYRQFNAGENKLEVQQSIRDIKGLGYRGVLLGYAREVLANQSSAASLSEQVIRQEIQMWLDGTLQTVDMAQPGDFVALK